MKGEPLVAGWTVRAVRGDVPEVVHARVVPATVPGCVHTDLLAAGAIPDPFLDDHAETLQWVGRADWRYETQVSWDPATSGDRVDLVFEGLDTVAQTEVNGTVVASTWNMHRTYRFDVREHLRRGRNDIAVTFASAVRYADATSLQLGARPHANHHPFNAVRKMACNFGWDSAPGGPGRRRHGDRDAGARLDRGRPGRQGARRAAVVTSGLR